MREPPEDKASKRPAKASKGQQRPARRPTPANDTGEAQEAPELRAPPPPPAPPPAHVAAAPIESDARIDHAIFGDLPVARIWVYRLLRDSKGAEVKRCVLAGALPTELVTEDQIVVSYGPGRFRVIGRDSNNRIQGSPITFEFEDAAGRVPMAAEEVSLGPDGQAAPAPAAAATKEIIDKTFELMKAQGEATKTLIEQQAQAAQKLQEREHTFMSGANAELIKTLGAANGPESLLVTILRDRIKTLEDDNRALTRKVDELRDKMTDQRIELLGKDLEFTKVAVKALEPHAGVIVNSLLLMVGAWVSGRKNASPQMQSAMSTIVAQAQSAAPGLPTAPATPAPTTPKAGSIRIPSAEQLRAAIERGEPIPGPVLEFLGALQDKGMCPPDVWAVAQPHVDMHRRT